jgi:hypothetical protein
MLAKHGMPSIQQPSQWAAPTRKRIYAPRMRNATSPRRRRTWQTSPARSVERPAISAQKRPAGIRCLAGVTRDGKNAWMEQSKGDFRWLGTAWLGGAGFGVARRGMAM